MITKHRWLYFNDHWTIAEFHLKDDDAPPGSFELPGSNEGCDEDDLDEYRAFYGYRIFWGDWIPSPNSSERSS